MVVYIIGVIVLAEAGLMLLPVLVALLYGEEKQLFAYLVSAVGLAAAGVLLRLFKPKKKAIYSKDGFIAVALGWIVLSLGGSLPFIIGGDIP